MSKLNIQDTSKSLFGNLKNQAQKKHNTPVVQVKDSPIKTDRPIKEESNPGPSEKSTGEESSYSTFERVTVAITQEQKDVLDRLAKSARRQRSMNGIKPADRERITANTIVRALLQNFLEREHLLSAEPINSEDQAKDWIGTLFRNTRDKSENV